MKNLLEFVLKSIVQNPDDVKVEESAVNDYSTDIKAEVNPTDCGIMIGKKGVIAKALRDLVKVKSIIDQKHYFLHLVVPPKESVSGQVLADESVSDSASELTKV